MSARRRLSAFSAAFTLLAALPAFGQDASVKITPVGFISFTALSRSTVVVPPSATTGSVLMTGFGSIPYDNTVQGNIGETKFSGADTRLGLRTEAAFGRVNVNGYFAGDFLGNDSAGVYVTSNSHPFRLYLAYVDVSNGRWEVLGGQAWSWITPNRHGLSSEPSDVFDTLNVDPNRQVGLPWSRVGQIRLVFHPFKDLAVGAALENRDQFVGIGEVILPFAFNAQLGVQMDAGNNQSITGWTPEFVAKAAYDPTFGSIRVHAEAGALRRTFEVTTLDIGATDFSRKSTHGYGFTGGFIVEVAGVVRVIGNGFWSEGGGRYIAGLGPDFVVVPDATATTINLSTVNARSLLGGAEVLLGSRDQIGLYYGRADFDSNFFIDTTSPLVTKPEIGFGGTNSPNSANKEIHEYTAAVQHTLWKGAGKGEVQALGQFSVVRREPWFVATGAPDKARAYVAYASFRYLLP